MRRNFTAVMAARMKTINVVKIAMPPPRGTVARANLSAVGWATNPSRAASFVTTAVKTADSANEPTNKSIANMVNVSILTAPVIVF